MVEQGTHKPLVGSSNLPLATKRPGLHRAVFVPAGSLSPQSTLPVATPALTCGDVDRHGYDLVEVAVVADHVNGHRTARIVSGDQGAAALGISLDDLASQHRVDDVFAPKALFVSFP